jgi:3-oxoacyl-[acyl-carrier-protein] synthase II
VALRQPGGRRVVLTGIGMVTPLGNTREETWEGVVAGRSGGATITNFPLRDAPVRFACEVKDFDPTVAMDRKLARRTDRYCQFVLVAAREAVEDSGLDVTADGLGERTGTAVATGIGGLQTLDLAHEHLFAKGIDRMSPLWITMLIPNMGAAMVSMEYGFRGPSSTVTTACAASSMAIGDAVGIIRDGRADVMVAGGSEAPITPIGVGGFYAMRAISQRNDDPETASRPFDAGRDGFVIGEGSTIVVIEELEHARARGARIYGEIMGYGCTADAHHFTEPDPTGVNPARAMRLALEEAEMQPGAIDYINAHGTSTPVGDAAETRVIKMVLGEERAYDVPVSSTKSMTGHMLGAAGSTELAITALALCRGILPPTINQFEPDPECDLDYVPNTARTGIDARVGLSNGFGFGGHNASLIIERWDDSDGRRVT